MARKMETRKRCIFEGEESEDQTTSKRFKFSENVSLEDM